MHKKRLEVVELNEEKEKIVLKEKESWWIIFLRRYGLGIFIILILLLIVSLYLVFSGIGSTGNEKIKNANVDISIDNADVSVNSSLAMSDDDAVSRFNEIGLFKKSGVVITVKVTKNEKFAIKFFSDGTALMIMNDGSVVTRVTAVDDGEYGISEDGVISSKAKTKQVSKVSSKEYTYGTVIYYSDGSCEVINGEFDLFVRNGEDVLDDYISNSRVSYLKETKEISGYQFNYYYDGTVEIIRDDEHYVVRDIDDVVVNDGKINFPYDNMGTLINIITTDNNEVIRYYSDGGAVICNGNTCISVRKSNSITINENKIYEIVDSKYVSVSGERNNVTYYTNGCAVVNDYNGTTYYVFENSDVVYTDGGITSIGDNYEELSSDIVSGTDEVLKFETVALVITDDYKAVVDIDRVVINKDGTIKEIEIDSDNEDNPIVITNNTNQEIKYRLVIEESDTSNLLAKYIKFQASIGDDVVKPTYLNANIWDVTEDEIKSLSINGVNYILVDRTLDAYATDNIQLMLWIDYEEITNDMQDKYFYGTLKIYAWIEE